MYKTTCLILLNILLITSFGMAQISTPVRFTKQNEFTNNPEAFLLGLGNDDLLMIWSENPTRTIKYSRSTDGGITWLLENIIQDYLTVSRESEINAIVLNSGRILVTFWSNVYLYTYSDDNGYSWSTPAPLPVKNTLQERWRVYYTSLSVLSNGSAAFIYSYSSTQTSSPKGVYAIYSSDGITWSSEKVIDQQGFYGYAASMNDLKNIVVFHDTSGGRSNIYYRVSTDGGNIWSVRQTLIDDIYIKTQPRIVKDDSGKLYLYFQKSDPTIFNGIFQSEIYFATSSDNGESWGATEKFTSYAGMDLNHKVSLWKNKPVITFSSSRNYQINKQVLQIFYGSLPDESSPPYLYQYVQSPQDVTAGQQVNIKAYAAGKSKINSLKIITMKDAVQIDTLSMYDDGLHADSLEGDGIYGIIFQGFQPGDGIKYYFLLTDDENNTAGFNGGSINIQLDFNLSSYLINVNRFKFPLNNRGVIADVVVDGNSGGRFDGPVILFSGGFYLTGKIGEITWASGSASASRVQDYLPGRTGSSPSDPKNQLYVVKSSDPHFGQSWQNYRYAIATGAKFYDGNRDGIYNPIDLNGNGMWDLNEDRPDILGDVTAWCVYNDAVPSEQRRFSTAYPVGIDIMQTVFSLGNTLTGPIENMFFIRYVISNTGTITEEVDSVYFSFWADLDIGQYYNDLAGSDSLLNTGYVYSRGNDYDFGNNPPSVGIALLQGAVVYIPGETFVDVNKNNSFEPDIDTPLDTALANNGLFIGSKVYPGAKNLKVTSVSHYMKSHPTLGDPNSAQEARYYSLGFLRFGSLVDPCTWLFGEVSGGIDCRGVNPLFVYSGDPVTKRGWINTAPTDQRILVTTGPFKLQSGKPVELWGAYVAGRGVDSLDSVTKMKEYINYAHSFYRSNFSSLPVEVESAVSLPSEFSLFQNYPNPFNPITKIRFSIPAVETEFIPSLQLRVYDILGREIEVLVNEEKAPGTYEVQFDGSKLSSGVYFYQLKAGKFISTKKMLLLR